MEKFYKILSSIFIKFYATANQERECELELPSDGETEKLKCKQKWRILGGVEIQCVDLDKY